MTYEKFENHRGGMMENQPKKQGSKMWVFLVVIGTLAGMSALKLAYDTGWVKGRTEGVLLTELALDQVRVCRNSNVVALASVDKMTENWQVVTDDLESLADDYSQLMANYEIANDGLGELQTAYIGCQNDRQYLEVLALDRLLEIQELKEQ